MICDVCFSPMLLYPFHTSHTNLSITKIDKRSIKRKNMGILCGIESDRIYNRAVEKDDFKICKTVKL